MEQKLTIKRSSELQKKDFESDNEVRWCPGCGDYAILSSVQKVLPELGIPKENFAFISGIGCASRFPYYMSTYGFHTIHGRAPTIATGIKLMKPELSVWVVTGDGDGFSIGTNHLLHLMRRNLDITVLLFNNKIYGLTKGQYSPTSQKGSVTKSSPTGSIDEPLSPISLALAANCSFVARAIDVDSKRLQEVLLAAAKHKGTSFVEIYQNCNVFNDGAFANVADRGIRDDRTFTIKPNEPIIFGENQDKTIEYINDVIKIKNITSKSQAFIYNTDKYPLLPQAMAKLSYPNSPEPMGIFKAELRPCYEEELKERIETSKKVSLDDILKSGSSWQKS